MAIKSAIKAFLICFCASVGTLACGVTSDSDGKTATASVTGTHTPVVNIVVRDTPTPGGEPTIQATSASVPTAAPEPTARAIVGGGNESPVSVPPTQAPPAPTQAPAPVGGSGGGLTIEFRPFSCGGYIFRVESDAPLVLVTWNVSAPGHAFADKRNTSESSDADGGLGYVIADYAWAGHGRNELTVTATNSAGVTVTKQESADC